MGFSTNGAGRSEYSQAKQRASYLPPYTELDSNWTIDLRVRTKAIKPSKENIRENIFGFK